ncbi:hypothetical protein CMV_026393 [Castanea mollissima]|uniref:Uncharacterized protein n=1 Tax=Castanea mollissima TaxID=60419 RepID=A0A8J4QBX6_9ROSI|nr:hypothetical protein CMV_026393 [Castanea mollissima]
MRRGSMGWGRGRLKTANQEGLGFMRFSDFLPLPMIGSISEPENENSCSKQKGRLRGKAASKEKKNAASCNVPRKIRFKKCEQQSQVCSGTIEKKKHPKPCSKRKKCIKPVAENQSLVLLPESLESGTTNGECVEAAIDNNSTSNKKTSKHYSRRIKCTTDLGGNQNAMLSSAKPMLSGITNDEHPLDHVSCLDSTLLPITNGEVVDSMNEHMRTAKKRPTKLRSKRKKCMELAEDSHSFSSHLESGEFGKSDGEGVENSILDMEKEAVKQQKRRKIRNEPSGKCQDVFVLLQQDTLEVSKHRNVSSKQILGATNGDDITLARFPIDVIETIREGASLLFQRLGLRDFARIDGWFLPNSVHMSSSESKFGRTELGNIIFTDINLISGMEQTSFLFQQSSKVGFSHSNILRTIIYRACLRFPNLASFSSGSSHFPRRSKSAQISEAFSINESTHKVLSFLEGTHQSGKYLL